MDNTKDIPTTMWSWRITGVEFLFAWYDLWIGLFWDKKKRWLYILPVPMLGIIIKFDNHAVVRRTRRVMCKSWPNCNCIGRGEIDRRTGRCGG